VGMTKEDLLVEIDEHRRDVTYRRRMSCAREAEVHAQMVVAYYVLAVIAFVLIGLTSL
jgi:hypothetical protein